MKTQICNFVKTHKIAFAIGALLLVSILVSTLRERVHRAAFESEISALKTENTKLKGELAESALKVANLETERAAEDLRRETYIEPAREIARAQSQKLDEPLSRARKIYEKILNPQTRFDLLPRLEPDDLFLANCKQLAELAGAIITDCPSANAPGAN